MATRETTETYRRLPQQITERGPWQQTATGHAFFLADPRPEEVRLNDLALGLSRMTRYNGQTKAGVELYSIAQHQTLISYWMQQDGCSPAECYAGLHHDSPEGYYGDVISQLKYCVPELRPFMARVDAAVFEALEIVWTSELRRLVKQYDLIALATEVRDLVAPNRTEYTWGDLPEPRPVRLFPWSSRVARWHFLDRHHELTRGL